LQNYYNGANKYKKIKSPTLLGKLFGKSERTIRRELHRGKVEHLNTHLESIIEYNAEYAQEAAEDKYSAKGPELKIGMDWVLVNEVSIMIKEYHYSPYAVVQHFNRTG
jgi:IS30 family transposase